MTESVKNGGTARSLNPWVLHLQKLGLELKCPLCLSYLSQPILLPCDHIFCKSCIPSSVQTKLVCPICTTLYLNQEVRPARFIENIVAIYRSLDAAFCASAGHPITSGFGRVSVGHPAQNIDGQSSKETVENALRNNPSGGQSLSLAASWPSEIPILHSVKDGVGSSDKMDTRNCPRHSGGEEFDPSDGNDRLALPSSQLRSARNEGCEAVKMDVNQLTQSSPGSPPSFGDNRGSDDENSDQYCKLSLESYSAKRPIDNSSRQGRSGISVPGTKESHVNDFKRQKKLNYEASEIRSGSDGNSRSAVINCIGSIITSPGEEMRSTTLHSELPVTSESPKAFQFTCAFCQTSSVSEATGSMLHFVNGNPVVGDQLSNSDVIHVHTNCIEWAPQAYFEGEIVRNLEKELARGTKLKCCRCGLKGAALGCYVKSCKRSYHLPCAVDVKGCRWNTDKFLFLCPAHASSRFPGEKSKSRSFISRNSFVQNQIVSQLPSSWEVAPGGAKEWFFCGSALSAEEKFLLVEFAQMAGVTVSKNWRPNITHVIANTDANGACTRTFKVLMAIFKGCWVLKIDWIKACLEAMRPVDEEPYEICLDYHGTRDGPKTGRLRALNNAPKLFEGLNFYFTGDFLPSSGKELQELIKAGGGHVLDSQEILHAQSILTSGIIIVYNLEVPEEFQAEKELTLLYERLTEAQDLAGKVGGQIVGHTWILESIAACKLMPFVH